MARINIEDSLFKDDRFTELAINLGSRTMALGALVEAFILAQEHYTTTVNDRLIPFKEWKRFKHGDVLIETLWAETHEKGVYVSGSKEQFKWLVQRQEAGKKSAEAKQAKKESTTVDDRSAESDGSQPLTPPLPLSPTQAPARALAAVENPKPSETCGAIAELADEGLNDVLAGINKEAQKRWLKTYKDAAWIKEVLNEAISFYTARGDDCSKKWGVVLHQSLKRAKAAHKNSNPTAPDYWASVFGGNEAVA